MTNNIIQNKITNINNIKGAIRLKTWDAFYAIPLVRRTRNERNKLSVPYLIPKGRILSSLFILQRHTATQCSQCIDIICVDTWSLTHMNKKRRFLVNYLLYSMQYTRNWVVQTQVATTEELASVTKIYPSTNWLEREVWDLFGIYFKGHPDLRRILTDYGFKAHPLRKNFPVTGFEEIYYNDATKSIIYEPAILLQEYRTFTFDPVWLTGSKRTEYKDIKQKKTHIKPNKIDSLSSVTKRSYHTTADITSKLLSRFEVSSDDITTFALKKIRAYKERSIDIMKRRALREEMDSNKGSLWMPTAERALWIKERVNKYVIEDWNSWEKAITKETLMFVKPNFEQIYQDILDNNVSVETPAKEKKKIYKELEGIVATYVNGLITELMLRLKLEFDEVGKHEEDIIRNMVERTKEDEIRVNIIREKETKDRELRETAKLEREEKARQKQEKKEIAREKRKKIKEEAESALQPVRYTELENFKENNEALLEDDQPLNRDNTEENVMLEIAENEELTDVEKKQEFAAWKDYFKQRTIWEEIANKKKEKKAKKLKSDEEQEIDKANYVTWKLREKKKKKEKMEKEEKDNLEKEKRLRQLEEYTKAKAEKEKMEKDRIISERKENLEKAENDIDNNMLLSNEEKIIKKKELKEQAWLDWKAEDKLKRKKEKKEKEEKEAMRHTELTMKRKEKSPFKQWLHARILQEQSVVHKSWNEIVTKLALECDSGATLEAKDNTEKELLKDISEIKENISEGNKETWQEKKARKEKELKEKKTREKEAKELKSKEQTEKKRQKRREKKEKKKGETIIDDK